jgi:hypothetical protein
MTNAERAERARKAFAQVQHFNDGQVAQIYDLVVDLCHLADVVAPSDPDWGERAERESAGRYVLDLAEMNYTAEAAEEVAS